MPLNKETKPNQIKNNCMDILTDKMARLHARRPEHGDKKETLKEKTESNLKAAKHNSIRSNYSKAKFDNNTGLQRNWGKHKNTRFYLIWRCWIQIWNPFLLITSSFF